MLALRSCLIFITVINISACTTTYNSAFDSFKAVIALQKQQPEFTQAQIDATPYAQIGVQLQKLTVLFILTRVNNHTLYWQNGAQESLIEDHGLIVRTTGLTNNNNIEQSRFIGQNPFINGLNTINDGTKAKREIDFSSFRYGTISESTFYNKGSETITITKNSYTLTRIEEHVINTAINLNATNIYWVDNTGFIWKSQQTLWPNFTLTISQLKPFKAAQ